VSPGGEVVLVLSGGGAKAMAHLGAMRALAESGIRPTRFVGTSMGAAVGAALAARMTPDAIEEQMRGITRREVAAVSAVSLAKGLYARAILKAAPLKRTLSALLPARRFGELGLPLTVTAADLDTGDLVQFGAGGEDIPLVDAVYASCALPLLYPAALIGGRRLADGGLRGVVGLEVAKGLAADLVIAVDVGPGFDMARRTAGGVVPPAIQVHNEAQWVLMADASRLQLALWRATPGLPPLLYVRPVVRHGATFAVDQADYYVDEGYRATREALSHWRG
jgi:NTE family protein